MSLALPSNPTLGQTATVAGSQYLYTEKGWRKAGNTVKVVPTSTWVSLPLPATYVGLMYVTDIGTGGSYWASNGVTWSLVGGQCVLWSTAIAQPAHTGTLTVTPIIQKVIPGGLLGLNGCLKVEQKWSCTNNTNLKIAYLYYGGATQSGVGFTNTNSQGVRTSMQNRGVSNSQISNNGSVLGTSNGTSNWLISSTNSLIDQTLTISASIANVADSMTLESYQIELVRT